MGQIKHNKQKAKQAANFYRNKKPLNKAQQEHLNEILSTEIPTAKHKTDFGVEHIDGGEAHTHWGKALLLLGSFLKPIGTTPIMPGISDNDHNSLSSAKMNHQPNLFNTIAHVNTLGNQVIPKLVTQDTLPQQFTIEGKTLTFRGAYLDPQVLKETLSANPNINTFDVIGCIISPKIAKEVGKAFEDTNVKKLTLRGAELGQEGALALVKGLRYTKVKNLNLAGNKIGANKVDTIVNALKPTKVEDLNLADNDLGFKGAVEAIKSLGHRIHKLNLSMNNIVDHMPAIAIYLSIYTKVTDFNIEGNDISIKDIAEIKYFLRGTKIIVDLGYMDYTKTKAVQASLDKLLRDNEELSRLKALKIQIYNNWKKATAKKDSTVKLTTTEKTNTKEGTKEDTVKEVAKGVAQVVVKRVAEDATQKATTTMKLDTTEKDSTVKPTTTEKVATTKKGITTQETATSMKSTAEEATTKGAGTTKKDVTTEGNKLVDLLLAKVTGVASTAASVAFATAKKEATTEQQFIINEEPVHQSGFVIPEEKKLIDWFLAKVTGSSIAGVVFLAGVLGSAFGLYKLCGKKASGSESQDDNTNASCDTGTLPLSTLQTNCNNIDTVLRISTDQELISNISDPSVNNEMDLVGDDSQASNELLTHLKDCFVV
ncbi:MULTISPECIES: hypothetical protein [unclassified Candidatus Tisiphia]|uniref:hypothetical protein n=1 Tax=unclassified Candidatus Tisiphia TaxID=2996318 RepID=UPI00312C8A7A